MVLKTGGFKSRSVGGKLSTVDMTYIQKLFEQCLWPLEKYEFQRILADFTRDKKNGKGLIQLILQGLLITVYCFDTLHFYNTAMSQQ